MIGAENYQDARRPRTAQGVMPLKVIAVSTPFRFGLNLLGFKPFHRRVRGESAKEIRAPEERFRDDGSKKCVGLLSRDWLEAASEDPSRGHREVPAGASVSKDHNRVKRWCFAR
jgi:hypothetical protein